MLLSTQNLLNATGELNFKFYVNFVGSRMVATRAQRNHVEVQCCRRAPASCLDKRASVRTVLQVGRSAGAECAGGKGRMGQEVGVLTLAN